MGTAGESVPRSQGTGGMLELAPWFVHWHSMTCGGEWEMDILPAATLAPQVPPAWHKRGIMFTEEHKKTHNVI
jgi:hypothetical protein